MTRQQPDHELKQLLVDTLISCKNAGWISCDKRFIGSNRSIFMLPIEWTKNQSIKDIFVHFVNKHYGNCDKSDLLRYTVSGSMNTNIQVEGFIKQDFRVTKDKRGVIHYDFGDGTIGLFPVKGTYKIAISKILENKFRETKDYKYALLLRVSNNIHAYHMAEAKKHNLSCRKFIANVNEALAPLVIGLARDEESRSVVGKYMRRSLDEVVRFYSPFNSRKLMQEVLL